MYFLNQSSTWFIAQFNDIDKEALVNYKYSVIDNSPLSKYILNPFWNFLVKHIPNTLHPNVLTLSGFFLFLIHFFIIWYYDCDFKSNDVYHGNSSSLFPSFVWLASSIFIFVSHALDGADGKQARKLKISSPIGEFIDHGLDSMVMVMFPLVIMSVFATGTLNLSNLRLLCLYLVVIGNFFICQWRKYGTGVLYLPWSYDFLMIFFSVLMVFLFFTDGELLNMIGVDINILFFGVEVLAYLNVFIFTLASTFYDFAVISRNVENQFYWLMNTIFPGFSFLALIVVSLLWNHLSVINVLQTNTRIFLLITGIIFSNLTCRLIILQLCKRKSEKFNILLVLPILAVLSLSIYPSPTVELIFLYVTFFSSIVIHFSYFLSVLLGLKYTLSTNLIIVP